MRMVDDEKHDDMNTTAGYEPASCDVTKKNASRHHPAPPPHQGM